MNPIYKIAVKLAHKSHDSEVSRLWLPHSHFTSSISMLSYFVMIMYTDIRATLSKALVMSTSNLIYEPHCQRHWSGLRVFIGNSIQQCQRFPLTMGIASMSQ